MTWDPKDPWSKKADPLEDALKQAQAQFKNIFPPGGLKDLLPSGGIWNILIAGLLILLVWQSVFIVAPDEEGVVKRFGIPVRAADTGPHFKMPFVETVLQPKVEKLHRVEVRVPHHPTGPPADGAPRGSDADRRYEHSRDRVHRPI